MYNSLEALKGDRKAQYSIRNDQWRICFEWPEALKLGKESPYANSDSYIRVNPYLTKLKWLTIGICPNMVEASCKWEGFVSPPRFLGGKNGTKSIIEMAEIMEDRWLSVDEMGKYLGVSNDTVYRWIGRHRMPAHRMGRLWKFKKNEVDDWVKTGGAVDKSRKNEN